jgi:hypothetical protein
MLLRIVLYTFNYFDFAKPLGCNILIRTYSGWDTASKDWEHMVLHLPHTEGGFGVPFNCVTKDAAFYATTARFVSWMGAFPQERQKLWLPKDDLQDSSSWSSTPLLLLRDIHSRLVTQYDCKEVCAPSQP